MARGKMFCWRDSVRVLMGVACLAGAVELTAGQASAHVVYRQPLNEVGTQTTYVISNSGWVAGLNPVTQTDSHQNRFLWFRLDQPSHVNFTISAIDGFRYVPHGSTTEVTALGDLNPGYSIFEGLAPHLSHDGSTYPGQTAVAPWSPFAGPTYHTTVDPNSQKWGEFRSNADFTIASDYNPDGTQRAPGEPALYNTLHFIAGDANHTGHTISGSYFLDPGTYTLTVGGANFQNLADVFTNMVASEGCKIAGPACDAFREARLTGRGFTINFKATPVPLPAAVYLFGAGLAGLAGLARRKKVDA